MNSDANVRQTWRSALLALPLLVVAPPTFAQAESSTLMTPFAYPETQRGDVVAAFGECGCTLDAVDRRGDWSILRLTAGAERYVPTRPIDPKGRDGWALDL